MKGKTKNEKGRRRKEKWNEGSERKGVKINGNETTNHKERDEIKLVKIKQSRKRKRKLEKWKKSIPLTTKLEPSTRNKTKLEKKEKTPDM